MIYMYYMRTLDLELRLASPTCHVPPRDAYGCYTIELGGLSTRAIRRKR